MKKTNTYAEAVEELEKILLSLEENEEFDMDDIVAKTKRAAELIKYCKQKLHDVDKELEKILEDI